MGKGLRDGQAEPSAAWGCAVCGTELAMITVAGSDKNDEDLPDGPSARAGDSTTDDTVSPVCTICAECETYYEKTYGMPEIISTTTCSSCGSKCTKCIIECDISNCENLSAHYKRCVPKGKNTVKPCDKYITHSLLF
jgi:hypothetical protein